MAYEVNIKGLEKLDEMIAKAERLGEALGGVKDQAEGIGNAAQSSASKASNSTTGIYSRRERYRAEHDDLISRGVSEGTQYNDAKVRMLKADKAVERWENSLKPKTEEDRLRDVLMTSRIGPDGKLYPIVGRMMAAGLMGNESLDTLKAGMMKGAASAIPGVGGQIARGLANAVGVAGAAEGAGVSSAAAAGIATAAAPAIIAAAVAAVGIASRNEAARIGRDAANTYYGAGGGVSGLTSLGNFFGTSGPEEAGNANALGDKLRGGGYGAAYLRQKGIYDLGIWQNDRSENYKRTLDALWSDPNESRAIRVARDLGLSDKMYGRDLNESTRNQILEGEKWRDAEWTRRVGAASQADAQATAGMWDQAKIGMAALWHHAGGGLFSDAYRTATSGDIQGNDVARVGLKALVQGIGGPIGMGLLEDSIDRAFPHRRSRSNKQATAGDGEFGENVGRAARQETIGGGERMRGAVPAGWRQIQMDEALQGQAANLGAFNA